MSSRDSLRPLGRISGERGAALIAAVLLLFVVTVMATGGYWLSRGELNAAQGHSLSVRALHAAEAGLAKYLEVVTPTDTGASMNFDVYNECGVPSDPNYDPLCVPSADTIDALTSYDPIPPSPAQFDFLDATVTVTPILQMVGSDVDLYILRSQATVTDPRDPTGLKTTRTVDIEAEATAPFSLVGVFAALGGVNFDGIPVPPGGGDDEKDHFHFDGRAKKAKEGGSCGGQQTLTNIALPTGQYQWPDNPPCVGDGCPYKWHMKPDNNPTPIDSTYLSGTQLYQATEIDWPALLSDAYYSGLDFVLEMNDPNVYEATFPKAGWDTLKNQALWPIVRFHGDLTLDQWTKGAGVLVVEGNVNVMVPKMEWTGVLLVGGTINTFDDAHIHVKGAAMAGLSCSEADRMAGLCRSNLNGTHSDFKYRPCEIAAAVSRMKVLHPVEGVWRETGN